MRKAFHIALLLAVAACGTNEGHDTESVPEAFHQKWTTYSGLQRDVEVTCDWLLFRSLQDSVRDAAGVVEMAEADPGHWYRTPARDQGCYVAGQDKGSKSTISQDMLVGLAVYLWQKGDASRAQAVADYADSHTFVMGEGDPFRTVMRGLYVTFRAIAARAGDGAVAPPPKVENPDPYQGDVHQLTQQDADALLVQTGFRAHLTVLHILLRGLVWGGVTDLEVSVLRAQAERQPRNALYQAAFHRFTDGDQTAAVAALMDTSLWPADRLPTGADHCDGWLWQRDDGTLDWAPCAEGDPARDAVHSGADWLFAAAVVRNQVRQAPLALALKEGL